MFKRETIPNQNLVKYLAASYLYYEEDFSVMADHEFDILCLDLYSEFDKVTHWAKGLVSADTLLTGSGFDLFGKIPGAIVAIARIWRENIETGRVEAGLYPKRIEGDK